MNLSRLLHILSGALLLAFSAAPSPAQINSTWLGDGTGHFSDGNWSEPTFWNPAQVPNNNGGTTYNVTIQYAEVPGADGFNGPLLDIDATVQNLTLINSVFVTNQGNPGTHLTVNGTTSLTTSAGHDGQYAAIFTAQGTWLLGNLTNYDAGTHTLTGPFFYPFDNTTIGWHGADVVTNKGTLFLGGANARLIDQDTNLSAIRNLAVNMGGLEFENGATFTTAGEFTNSNSLSIVTDTSGLNSAFTVSGSFTNFDSATKTLTDGYIGVEVRNGANATATLRFPNADIRNINNATIKIAGTGASIQDLNGLNALRNLSGINGGSLTSAGTLTITPDGGIFTNSGSTHIIDSGANITIQGNHQVMNGGMVQIGAPNDSSNTTLTITGNSIIDGGGIDLGGQPGVNTQYHTQLQVMHGIEFRGAYLTGTGTTFADVGMIQGSVFAPGHSPGQQTIVGAVSFDSSTTLQFEIGGLSAGDEYDQLVQQGTSLCTVGGTLQLSFVNGFENSIQLADTFDIVTSDNVISGNFENVASGDRLATQGGEGSFKVTYAGQKTVTLSEYHAFPALVSAVSRQTHGGQGSFDIPVAITGNPTIEPRNGGNYQVIFTFNNNMVDGSVDVDAPKGGSISSTSFDGNSVTVNLTSVADIQKLTFSLTGMQDEFEQSAPDSEIVMYVLVGDTNADGRVNSADATFTRNHSGQPADATNFRADFNHDGNINSADATAVRARSGNSTVGLDATKAWRASVR